MIHRDGHMIIHGKREGRNLEQKLKPSVDLRTAKPSRLSTVCGFRSLSTDRWFRNPNFGGGKRRPQQSRGGRDQNAEQKMEAMQRRVEEEEIKQN